MSSKPQPHRVVSQRNAQVSLHPGAVAATFVLQPRGHGLRRLPNPEARSPGARLRCRTFAKGKGPTLEAWKPTYIIFLGLLIGIAPYYTQYPTNTQLWIKAPGLHWPFSADASHLSCSIILLKTLV